ncbi:MAG: PEP-CTERM sorting domain-containing protein, partial [Armatimonadota bacterium]
TNAGTLALENSHSITGSFIQTSDGVLDIGIAGTSLGDYGHLDISSAASLAGGLGLHLFGGFTLAEGQTFDLLNFASSTGDFTSLSLNGIACSSGGVDDWSCSNMNGYIDLKLSYAGSGSELDLVVGHQVPEPASLGLFATALAALGLIRRRKAA